MIRKLSHEEIAHQRISIEQSKEAERIPVTVLVDNVRSLYNVGSIFRTSDAIMIRNLILTGFTPHPPRREISKTALGATETVPWEYQKNGSDAVMHVKDAGIKVFALEITSSSKPYYSIEKSDFPLCIVIGNELTGISKEILQLCDGAIDIPMFGYKHSLNVAVAYGIAVFELGNIWRFAK
jgi:tRNA G18 (ribose-2'-O)-methylase SpoU